MQKAVRTLADLNRHNRTQSRVTARKLTRLLANGEIAIRAAENFTRATTSGAFFDSAHPPSLLCLAQEAERQLGAERGRDARRHNAKRTRTDLFRIGPEIKLPHGAPKVSYRLQRSMQWFYQQHARSVPRKSRKQSWIDLEREIARIADGEIVQLIKPSCKQGNVDIRTERYAFKIAGRPHEISSGQFEKYYTEGRKPLEMVR